MDNRLIYTGIGARKTPNDILGIMKIIAQKLAPRLVLRSGGAKGADTAFEKGCNIALGSKEIYLPWRKFNGNFSPHWRLCDEAHDIARDFHPNWNKLSTVAKKFMTRNVYQILGETLNTKTNFIMCWTPEGKIIGGTGQALRMAKHYKIPVFNLGDDESDTDRDARLYEILKVLDE